MQIHSEDHILTIAEIEAATDQMIAEIETAVTDQMIAETEAAATDQMIATDVAAFEVVVSCLN